jgi:hypothetical protein
MTSRFVWAVTVPLALVGSEIGHTLANVLFGSPAGKGGELFGGGFGALAPIAAVTAAVAVVALVGRALGAGGRAGHSVSALPIALLAPLAFVLQEHAELLLGHDYALLAPERAHAFLPGLALQLPFALAAFAAARGLLRLADGAQALLAWLRSPHAVACLHPPAFARAAGRIPRAARIGTRRGRAPPVQACLTA